MQLIEIMRRMKRAQNKAINTIGPFDHAVYICESINDLLESSSNLTLCFVLEDSTVYIKNSVHWEKLT